MQDRLVLVRFSLGHPHNEPHPAKYNKQVPPGCQEISLATNTFDSHSNYHMKEQRAEEAIAFLLVRGWRPCMGQHCLAEKAFDMLLYDLREDSGV